MYNRAFEINFPKVNQEECGVLEVYADNILAGNVEDNDYSNRTGKKAWKDDTDNAWRSTSVLGTLQIASCDNPVTAVTSEISEKATFNLYPNPFRTFYNIAFIAALKLPHLRMT